MYYMGEAKRKPLFRKGDVIAVLHFDQGDEVWKQGVIQIEWYRRNVMHTRNGAYGIKNLSGELRWVSCNIDCLEKDSFVKYMGNVKRDTTLKVLYGK